MIFLSHDLSVNEWERFFSTMYLYINELAIISMAVLPGMFKNPLNCHEGNSLEWVLSEMWAITLKIKF